ncbi:L domain-like protein [Rhizoclosmatium globosum]|uniref:L domain-like protein n=1 Tax=Rhizoclosmatium globosum TaxID=329046 RepID=A0A1Y2CL90_9FUNG|nr:L domain-like protein [Rhizoclosmatium globosum]|eukprot:ORY47792.1 L domain-like protein [Rhizoclosmatium globosum]
MLTGKIPSELEELTSLEELQLSGNDFEGEIPESLGNLVQLRVLRLYNNPELCGVLSIAFGKLKLLKAIEIHNTAIMGPIPVEICSLENLKRLDLSLQLNPDIPNVIPVEIASLSQLEELNLSECNLVGSIPQGLGQLPQLRVLLLNINNLSGESSDGFEFSRTGGLFFE